MKKFNFKLIVAALITTMLIPIGTASASDTNKKSNKDNQAKIFQQYKSTDDEDKVDENSKDDEKQVSSKWDWKVEKEKAKAELKMQKEEAKADWKIKKEEGKAEVKKTKEEVKKALKEQKIVIKQNNDKIHDLREDIIDQKKDVIEAIGYIKKNNIVISDDISKQIQDRLEMIKADIVALNSSKGTINNIYVDIKSQLEKKDSDAVQTGIKNVLALQDQRYISLQKLHDDLQVLLNLLNHAKETAQTPAPGTTTTTPASETSTDGQATTPAAGSETSTQTGTSTDANTQSTAPTPADSTTVPSQTTETQN